MVEPVVVDAPPNVGGPAIARAASGLALLPSNASRLVRLHRLAALGMAIADDSRKPLSSSAVRALLKRDDIGGSGILHQEDLSHDDLEAHGAWLQMVVDTFALDPGELTDPCSGDFMEDRLLETPFLRLPDGYQVVVPLDLLLTVRHHLLRFTYQEDQLEELGKR